MTDHPMIRIGLIGAGARLQLVVQRLLDIAGSNVQVAAVFDPDEGSVGKIRALFGEKVEECDSVEQLVARDDIQWVFIGSVNCFHAEQSILALRAGKHVFCEKPLATSFEDCLAVRNAVQECNRHFAFGLVLRYSPHYQKVHELVNSGILGKLISFEFNETLDFNHGGYIFGNWRRDNALAGTHLLEKCCHDLDLANWITGLLPQKVASFGGNDFFIPENAHLMEAIGPDLEGRPAYMTWDDPHRINPFSANAGIVDNQVCIFEYAGGVRATFHTNTNVAIRERRFYFCGTKGTLRSDAYTGEIEWKVIGHDTQVETCKFEQGDGHAGGDESLARGLLETLTKGSPPLATVDDGIRSCVVAFGADQSMASGQVVDYRPYWETVYPDTKANS